MKIKTSLYLMNLMIEKFKCATGFFRGEPRASCTAPCPCVLVCNVYMHGLIFGIIIIIIN